MLIKDAFEKLGFTEKEQKLYLSLAEIGKAGAGLLSKRTGIQRTTVYSALDTLVKKGVVSIEEKAGGTFYQANKPESLLRIVDKEKEEIRIKELVAGELSNLIEPFFMSKNFSVPRMQFFEGAENVKSMLYDHTDLWFKEVAKYSYTCWGFQDHTFVEHYLDWLKYYWKLMRAEDKVCLLSNESAVEIKLRGVIPGREIRAIPEHMKFSSTIWVMGECIIVIMTQQKPHYAFQIRDTVFANNLRSLFQLLWELSEQGVISSAVPGVNHD